MSKKYDVLRETALANFELLLGFWKVDYKEIQPNEYDFKNPTRDDRHFGACRFNTEKGYGADFAVRDLFNRDDFCKLGKGFTKADFGQNEQGTRTKSGFDIIGLCQRIYGYNTYKDGANRLRIDLKSLELSERLQKPLRNAAEQRRKINEAKNNQIVEYARRMWRACQDVSWDDTPGERYLKRRGIYLNDPCMRFHPQIIYKNGEEKRVLPAIIFKISEAPDSQLMAIHRIFLEPSGTKANIDDPKRVMARVKGFGIWFGEPCDTLWVAEGPEEAMTYLARGANFVVSTINATNYHNLSIPDYVTTLALAPDKDEAGQLAAEKAKKTYAKEGRKLVRGILPDG